MKHLSFGWVILAALILWGALVVGVIAAANASPPKDIAIDPSWHHWFERQRSPVTGLSCCAEADGTPVDYRFAKDHYEARIGENWIAIPNAIVIENSRNPTGFGVLWRYPADNLFCFAPASGA